MKEELEEIWNGPLQQATRINAWRENTYGTSPVLMPPEDEEEECDDEE